MSTHVPDDPSALDHTLEVSLGRRAPFTQVGDWVLLSGADSDARTLYWALSAHLNAARDNNEVWPGLLTLARLLGLKKPENVSKYMLQLEVIGAVEVIRSTTGLVRRNRYIVHQTPPAGYCGPQSMADWYSLNRALCDETPEERDAREAAFDAWLTATRQTLKEHCQQTAQARASARKSRAPLPPAIPFRGLHSRTPSAWGTERAGDSVNAAGRTVPPAAGVRTPAPEGLAPLRAGVEEDQEEQHQEPAPAARSVAHGRRPPTATGRQRRHSGSADRPLAPPAQPQGRLPRAASQRMSRAQAQVVQAVEAGLPEKLRALLPQWRPSALREIILLENRQRTAEELIARADRRWYAWGFASTADTSTGGAGLAHPVGVAVRLIASHRCPIAKCGRQCPDPRCEDGITIDTGQSCPRCIEHRSDHRDGTATHPAATSAGDRRLSRPECNECGRPMRGPAQPDGICRDCRHASATPAPLHGPEVLAQTPAAK